MRLLILLGLAAIAYVMLRLAAVRYASARLRPVLLAASVALILGALNAINLCAPGWCGWYGFPLYYYTWSDARGTFNNERFGYPEFHAMMAAANVTAALALCVVVFWYERRLAERSVPPPTQPARYA